jgi:hypothetical protein
MQSIAGVSEQTKVKTRTFKRKLHYNFSLKKTRMSLTLLMSKTLYLIQKHQKLTGALSFGFFLGFVT